MEGTFRLAHTRGLSVQCPARGEDYRIHIAEPVGEKPAGGWPVLYLLDAVGAFGTCVEALRRMERRPAATGVSPMAIVGISAPAGYDVARRQRDYTTPRSGTPDEKGSGGCAVFLDFLERQVLPLVADQMAVDPARRTLCGHSLAGFFTLWVLATRPELFRNYAAISPSVWWDKPALLHATPPTDRRVLVTMGEWEDALPPWQERAPDAASVIARRQSRGMVAGAREVVTHLQGALGEADARFVLLPEEDHASIVSAAMPRALRLASHG